MDKASAAWSLVVIFRVKVMCRSRFQKQNPLTWFHRPKVSYGLSNTCEYPFQVSVSPAPALGGFIIVQPGSFFVVNPRLICFSSQLALCPQWHEMEHSATKPEPPTRQSLPACNHERRILLFLLFFQLFVQPRLGSLLISLKTPSSPGGTQRAALLPGSQIQELKRQGKGAVKAGGDPDNDNMVVGAYEEIAQIEWPTPVGLGVGVQKQKEEV